MKVLIISFDIHFILIVIYRYILLDIPYWLFPVGSCLHCLYYSFEETGSEEGGLSEISRDLSEAGGLSEISEEQFEVVESSLEDRELEEAQNDEDQEVAIANPKGAPQGNRQGNFGPPPPQ